METATAGESDTGGRLAVVVNQVPVHFQIAFGLRLVCDPLGPNPKVVMASRRTRNITSQAEEASSSRS
jgi:hypothetical protein